MTFYKEGLNYKVLHEDGHVETWATDILIESEPHIQGRILDSSTGWIYFKTDKYETHFDWEKLNSLLTAADIINTLGIQYGLPAYVAAALLSYQKEVVYRIDETYYWQLDPFEWRIDSRIYAEKTYTTLISSFTSYRRVN